MHKVEAIISRTDSIKSFLRTRTYPVATVFEENDSTVQDKVRSRLVLFKIKDSSSQLYLFLNGKTCDYHFQLTNAGCFGKLEAKEKKYNEGDDKLFTPV